MPYAFNDKKEKVEVLEASQSATKADINELQSQLNSLNLDGRYYTKSQIDTKLNGKQNTVNGGASTITGSNLTANRALISNGSGKVGVSNITSSQLNQLSGVTGNIQSQLNNKMNVNPQSIELYFTTPFIDFHKDSSSADYTARLIQITDDMLDLRSNNSYWGAFRCRAVHAFGGGTHIPSVSFHYNGQEAITSEVEVRGVDRVDCVARNGGNNCKLYAGSFNQYSSKYLKKNIKSMTEKEAKKLLELRPVSFDYIDGDANQRGLVAEEVDEIYPEMVLRPEGFTEFNPDEPWNALSIDYAKLVPALIKMIQIQQKEIDALKQKVK